MIFFSQYMRMMPYLYVHAHEKKIRMANTSKNTNMKYDERALLLPDNNFAPGNSEFRQLM